MIQFRGFSPAERDQLAAALGNKIHRLQTRLQTAERNMVNGATISARQHFRCRDTVGCGPGGIGPILRANFAGREGPAVIEAPDTTLVVHAGQRAWVDRIGDLELTLRA